MSEIRTLRADEIECRVAMVKKTRYGVGCSLLLYKDARCDMAILDEVYGAMNWRREHVTIDGRLYCNLAVWDEEKKQWISKQDVGTESNTEKEKGQASDSFKRAGTNWGIGRELYTAPFICINLKEDEYTERNGKPTCTQSFFVSEIEYSEHRKIQKLVICDKNGNVRYPQNFPAENHQDKPQEEAEPKPSPKDTKISAAKSKANDVKRLLVESCGGDKQMAQQMWNSQYKADAGDIVKMNAALIKLERMNALDA